MEADSTSLCTWVKYLPHLLRNKVNSQQHPNVYEDRRPKNTEDTEKTDSKGIASGQKGPWDQHGDQGDFSHRPSGPATGFLGESRVNSSLLYQPTLEQHRERPSCLKPQGGNKDKVVNPRRLWVPTGES